jgi:hypothetical protein
MAQRMIDVGWRADPSQPGRIHAGEAVTVEVRIAPWRVDGGDAEAAHLGVETERLCLAAPTMAKALLANGCRRPPVEHSAWHTHDCWASKRASCTEACLATCAALKAAGFDPP